MLLIWKHTADCLPGSIPSGKVQTGPLSEGLPVLVFLSLGVSAPEGTRLGGAAGMGAFAQQELWCPHACGTYPTSEW